MCQPKRHYYPSFTQYTLYQTHTRLPHRKPVDKVNKIHENNKENVDLKYLTHTLLCNQFFVA